MSFQWAGQIEGLESAVDQAKASDGVGKAAALDCSCAGTTIQEQAIHRSRSLEWPGRTWGCMTEAIRKRNSDVQAGAPVPVPTIVGAMLTLGASREYWGMWCSKAG